MLDNELIKLVIATLLAGEASAGIPGIPIKQAYQPTMQGVNTQPTAYLYKIGDRRYGFRRVSDEWDLTNSKIVHTETQQYETTFQLSALATQDPKIPMQKTASDILNLLSYILQSQPTVATFETQGVGIERVTDVRNPYFVDDRQNFEASPSFDFVLTHKQIIVTETPIIQGTELQVFEV